MTNNIFVSIIFILSFAWNGAGAAGQLNVVATLPDYGVIVKAIGGDRVKVETIVLGDQDAHFIRPKPSFVTMVKNADLLIGTGLDLELWLPTVVNKSGNTRVRSGQPGFVAASKGIDLLEKPVNMSRSEGGVHIYGNPHITCSPLNIKKAAENISIGLIRNDPGGIKYYKVNLKKFLSEIDNHLFGKKLVTFLGGKILCAMTENETLLPFLRGHKFRGKPLIDYLGGWMKKMLPLRGAQIVTYHKNWAYFIKLFGLKERGTIEPKPGIPPSVKHVTELIDLMKKEKVKLLFAANYFDKQKIKTVASKVDAEPIIVPMLVGGAPGTEDYFKLLDLWVDKLIRAAAKKGIISQENIKS